MTEQFDDTLASLRENFAAATFPDGGLLLHLPSGDFFHLDAVAAAAWEVIARECDGEMTVAGTAAALQVPTDEARTVLVGVVAQAGALRDRRPAVAPVFRDDDELLSLQEGERTLMSLDKRSLTLTTTDALRERADEDIAAAFRVFVPKVYGRWFPLAMHASAVSVHGRSILFCGESGAGKTTTARTLAGEIAGSRVFSEDVVLFRDEDGVLMMVDGAEAAIHAWMADATAALVERREPRYRAITLKRALDREPGRLPVHKAIFLRADRRLGTAWSFERLPPSVVLSRLFVHSFFHSPQPGALREHLRACHALASQVGGADAIAVPATLAALRDDSRAQIETIAS